MRQRLGTLSRKKRVVVGCIASARRKEMKLKKSVCVRLPKPSFSDSSVLSSALIPVARWIIQEVVFDIHYLTCIEVWRGIGTAGVDPVLKLPILPPLLVVDAVGVSEGLSLLYGLPCQGHGDIAGSLSGHPITALHGSTCLLSYLVCAENDLDVVFGRGVNDRGCLGDGFAHCRLLVVSPIDFQPGLYL